MKRLLCILPMVLCAAAAHASKPGTDTVSVEYPTQNELVATIYTGCTVTNAPGLFTAKCTQEGPMGNTIFTGPWVTATSLVVTVGGVVNLSFTDSTHPCYVVGDTKYKGRMYYAVMCDDTSL